MFWILLVLYVLLFMFNMGMHTFIQFYRIRYRNKEFDGKEMTTCFFMSIFPLLNLIAAFIIILEFIELLCGCTVHELIKKLCRIGLK